MKKFIDGDMPLLFSEMDTEDIGSERSQLGMAEPVQIILGHTMKALIDAASSEAPHDSLSDFYHERQPKTAGEVLQLAPRVSWHDGHPLEFAEPWKRPRPGPRWRSIRETAMSNAAHSLGVDGWRPEFGWKGFGPPHDTLVDVEARRIKRVRGAIATEGFRLSMATTAIPFIAGDHVRFLPGQGMHRLAAAIALGYNTVPLRVLWSRRVTLKEAGDWPGVRAADFTEQEAVQVFGDTFFDRGV